MTHEIYMQSQFSYKYSPEAFGKGTQFSFYRYINLAMTFKSTKRIAYKHRPSRMDPGASTSSQQNPPTSRTRRDLSPEEKQELSKIFPCALEWMLANENIRLGDMIDTALCIIRKSKEDEVNWKELERDSSDEANGDTSDVGPRDPYGVLLASCFICGKADVTTRLTSCGVCCKKAHLSCSPWKAQQDPRSGYFNWECPDHELHPRLTQGDNSEE